MEDGDGEPMEVVAIYTRQNLGMLAGMFMTLSKKYGASVNCLLYCILTTLFNGTIFCPLRRTVLFKILYFLMLGHINNCMLI